MIPFLNVAIRSHHLKFLAQVKNMWVKPSFFPKTRFLCHTSYRLWYKGGNLGE